MIRKAFIDGADEFFVGRTGNLNVRRTEHGETETLVRSENLIEFAEFLLDQAIEYRAKEQTNG